MRALGQFLTGFCDRNVVLTGGDGNKCLGDLEGKFCFSGARANAGNSTLGLCHA